MKLAISMNFPHSSPEEWAMLHRNAGLEAVTFPCNHTAPVSLIDRYVAAAKDASLCIAEVGVWCNPLSPDPKLREANLQKCIHQLELAEYVHAACCVNISGAIGDVWDGSYPENYAPETYDRIVTCVQTILDRVNPKHTFYSLEPMPHMLPDSPESYLELMRDIDRPGFAVHLDLVNLLVSPREFYHNRELIDRCFDLLGKSVCCCHLKDAVLDHSLTVSIREAECGTGGVDFAHYIRRAEEANPDMPMIIEHLPNADAYTRAIAHIQSVYRTLHA